MLNLRHPSQRGIVLLLSLIVLAAMSLAAIGMMRSVLTSNRVAGNLAFQQSATQSADVGVERAVAWLEQKSREMMQPAVPPNAPKVPANTLFQNIKASAESADKTNYVAMREDPGPTQSWDVFWPILANAGQVNTLAPDAADNTVSYVIHRLCKGVGDPLTVGCESPATMSSSVANSSKSNGIKLKVPDQTYYRITVRVEGPRNAVSFVQVVVAI